MANDNHEVYDSENICTYTDYITVSNPFTNEQIDACILSAGTPNGFENRGEISNAQNVEQVAANSLSPWYSRSGMYLEYDTQECNQMEPASWQSYYHILYGYWADGNVGLCTNMDIKKYRNLVTITPASQTYYGHTFDYYKLSIKTQYGTTGDWNDSVLKPILVIPTETLRLGYDIGLDSYKHWAVTEMSSFGFRHTLTSYNTYISFNDGTGGLAPVTCPCSIGADFVWTPTSESDSKWFSDEHYNYGWYDINYGGGGGFHAYSFQEYNNIDDLLMIVAICGLKFEYDGVTYKPIVTGGIVTGYTSDMSEESEWDEWENIGDHTIPVDPTPVPPPPTPGGDDLDDHEMGAGTGISGMAQLWLLTKEQLDALHSAFNSAPGGFDPMNSLISVMGLGVAPTYLFDEIEYLANINIRKSDGTSWSTGVEGHIVDSQKSAFQFTGITVNRLYNNFLDYSPYAIHEIFIPMCGWLTLPDIAVDRSITVTYLPDVESLKCRAVVSVVDNSGHRCVIGEKDGIMGADVPFTNTGHSLYVGEAIINGMNVAGEVITGAIGAGFTKTNAKGGTYRPYEGFTVGMGGTLPGAIGNALVSGQTNRTHYMTGNGTRIGFSDGENIQIKSTYHKIDKPKNYDHTIGKVCNKTGELSEFKGFTVCNNPHITFSALEEEKDEIKRLLEEGVIL